MKPFTTIYNPLMMVPDPYVSGKQKKKFYHENTKKDIHCFVLPPFGVFVMDFLCKIYYFLG